MVSESGSPVVTKKRRPPRTFSEYCIAKKGVLGGARVASFAMAWTIATQAVGREITLLEYAEWWNESERTAYRHLKEFRDVFPSLSTPAPIAADAIAKNEALNRGAKGFGSLPLDIVPGLS